ncbi:hypothetical protein [Leptospira adleri]|uniref:Uncharacterized protein n=1 Tax=Leptospira adleri TaxID=2023186 RepID=A0A2M9YJB3_9LEPT|nr:hypothetical protein [Leptospira adleri]PJZ51594.1 hypothetical protein CH380_19300 [Leptospira adleri]PJZ61897.1 hypothetical protein CH376_10865 [Leptospira adleri]
MQDISREYLSNRLIKLGDMIGDGLHHENKSISSEYKRVLHELHPEIKKRKMEKGREQMNEMVNSVIETRSCDCGGKFIQKRKGAKVIICSSCKKRFIIKLKGKKK